jgi:FkbM family methyltransferase
MTREVFSERLLKALKLFYLRAIRLYTFNTPIAKGKHRAYLLALAPLKHMPDGILVHSKDGRVFSVDLSTKMQTTLFFVGEYEKAITAIAEGLIKENHCTTFLDIGANFGWYTTLFHKYAQNGQVHAFEPVPSTFDNLRRNYELMGKPNNVTINNVALGDHQGEVVVNLFEGLATGHASLSNQGRDDAVTIKSRMITLDNYLETNNLPDIDFVKVDIEGAELGFLRGASKLFRQSVPPIILMEMALNQTRNFGYYPNHLLEFISREAAYDFYKIDEIRGNLIRFDSFADNDIGANVICIPRSIGEKPAQHLF